MNLTDKNKGFICSASASALWGILPLFWNLLKQVPSDQILAHRIVWALAFMVIYISSIGKKGQLLRSFLHPKNIGLVFLATLFNCANWLIYIWAVNSGHVVEASMGYFINPLIAIMLGVTIFKEKLSPIQKTALAVAATGILILVAAYGKFPWISLILAVSFALYGLIKKIVPLDASVGLTMEMMLTAPFAIGYILWIQYVGAGAIGKIDLLTTALLLSSGIVTAVPLLLFTEGAKRTRLSIVGFLQYISPTISFLLGIFVFHEKLSSIDWISYSCIWTAVLMFALAGILQPKFAPSAYKPGCKK